MTISIIIPTLNAEKYLPELLNSLLNQTINDKEIIVIDSSSKDKTIERAKSYSCKTIIISKADFDHGGTRNKAAEISTGDILVFMTQDAIPFDKHFLENLIKPLIEDKAVASYGRQVYAADAFPTERFAREFNYPAKGFIKGMEDMPKLGVKTFFYSNVCAAVRKKEFIEIGKFPMSTIMNEDMLLAAKLITADYKIAYTADAIVKHSHNYSHLAYFKRYFDIGAFYNLNSWLLDYAKAEGEGIKFVKEQFKYLVKNKEYRWLTYAFNDTFFKYAGYRLGLMQDKLPLSLKRKFSMHSFFWK